MKTIKTANYIKLALNPLDDSGEVVQENEIAQEQPAIEQNANPQLEQNANPQLRQKDWATLKNIKEVDRILQNIEFGTGEVTAAATAAVNAIGSIVPNPLIQNDIKQKFITEIKMAYSNLNKILSETDKYFQEKKIEIIQNLGQKESQDYHQYVDSIHKYI